MQLGVVRANNPIVQLLRQTDLVKGNAKHKSFITKLSDEQIGAAAGHAKQLAGGK